MPTLVVTLFHLLPWVILLALAFVILLVALRLRSIAKGVRASGPIEGGALPVVCLNGGWDWNIHLDMVLLQVKAVRIGLPKINLEKHIRWTLIWWP